MPNAAVLGGAGQIFWPWEQSHLSGIPKVWVVPQASWHGGVQPGSGGSTGCSLSPACQASRRGVCFVLRSFSREGSGVRAAWSAARAAGLCGSHAELGG